MMKKVFYVLLFTSLVSVQAQSFGKVDLKDYTNKTYEFSIYFFCVAKVTLNSDYTYEAQYDSEGMWWYNKGTFTVEEDKLRLRPTVCKSGADSDGEIPCNETLGEATIQLHFTYTSLYCTEYLEVVSLTNPEVLGLGGDSPNAFTLDIPGKEVREGEMRKWEEMDVITMGKKKGITTSDVKIRKTPSVDGEIIEYREDPYAEEAQKAVPINTEVTVLARTPDKVKVQKWENYWYLVDIGMYQQVWMYGEFVKFN